MPHTTEIATERLLLRPHRGGDAVRIADLINDFDVVRMLSGPPWPYRLGDAEQFLSRTDAEIAGRELTFMIEHRDFGLVGIVGLHWEDRAPAPEIGYWLGRTFWRRGFATEAATALADWAFASWGRRALMSGHFADNPASGRVLTKAGFLYTGEVLLRRCLARRELVPTRMMIRLA